jgi:hypothetical protein
MAKLVQALGSLMRRMSSSSLQLSGIPKLNLPSLLLAKEAEAEVSDEETKRREDRREIGVASPIPPWGGTFGSL